MFTGTALAYTIPKANMVKNVRYNIHAGHNPAGKTAGGVSGLLNESKENRLVTAEIVRLLREAGQTVYDCTVSNGKDQRDVLEKIVDKSNAHKVDFDLSIHFNSGRNDKKGDQKVGGFEIYVTDTGKGKGALAARIRKAMKELGFTDRGTKTTSSLYVLNHTKAPALLLEICFVDDRDDYDLYKKLGYKKIAKAIAGAILGQTVIPSAPTLAPAPAKPVTAKKNRIAVDGMWGSATTRRLQQIFRTTVDGVVSNQYAMYRSENPGLTTGWDWQKKPAGSSELIRAIQKKTGAGVDGHIGPKTIRAMQKFFGTVQDGFISRPSDLVKAMQRWCNKQ